MSEIKPGDFVSIQGQDTVAEVLSVKGNNIEVAMGIMKMTVKKSQVTPAKAPVEEKRLPAENSQPISGIDTKEKMMRFQFELDVRGKMKEEVMIELTTWVDDALLLGVEQATIIHGRGNGILKNTVRSLLRKYKEIRETHDAAHDRGGDAVTVVVFDVK